MVEKASSLEKRKKPSFIRRDWYKRMRLGKRVKKKRIWRHAYGRHNKIRLKMKGYAQKPSPGFGERKELKGKMKGMEFEVVENFKQLEKIDNKMGIVIAKVGEKKREEIKKMAKEKGIKVLNRYGKKILEKKSSSKNDDKNSLEEKKTLEEKSSSEKIKVDKKVKVEKEKTKEKENATK
jgi:ribosomal protein L32E